MKHELFIRTAIEDNGVHFIGESRLSTYFSSNSEKSGKWTSLNVTDVSNQMCITCEHIYISELLMKRCGLECVLHGPNKMQVFQYGCSPLVKYISEVFVFNMHFFF